MQLVIPSSKYKESFLEALEEYQKQRALYRQDIYALNATDLRDNFQAYMDGLIDESHGEHLPSGYVPHTSLWLIDGDTFIGRVDIRHSLNEALLQEGGHIGYDIRPSQRNKGYGKKILELALPKAKALEITKVLITCDETNIASKKIIESNGGVLENRIEKGNGKPGKLRYWITV